MRNNPFLDRVAARTTTAHGRTSEKRVAKKLGARLHPNSGASRGAKSDASLEEEDFRLEMKSTTAITIRIEQGWLAKIAKEALAHGQRPGVVVSFVDGAGKPAMKHYAEWVLMPMDVFRELTNP